ncbi:MAG: biotin--[acetyl-CoA-carboxylase] ligase [Alphaproteobacteria bacterium]|nr:biotin--[acetyl-CoA-carboxylase] ligase [Alphaproteobacteria bacterium]
MQDPFLTCRDPTPIVTLDEIGSTNAEALRLAAHGEAGPLWVNARRQTAGRGRDGRDWTSLPGNLHASLLFTVWCDANQLPRLSLVAGVALAEAVGTLMAADEQRATPRLKWPNDLLFANRKCAGILVETTTRPAGQFACILGFGANIASAPLIPGRDVTSLSEQHMETTPLDLIARIDGAMRNAMAALSSPNGFTHIRQRWLANAVPMGTRLTVTTGNGMRNGLFAGLDEDGALLLEDETGSLTRITHGDVSACGGVV